MGVRGARQLALSESAAIAPLYAIGIFVLVGIAGVGFDYARMASLDSELQNAADQAALAGATQLDGKTGTCSRAASAARTFILNNTRFAKDGGSAAVTFQDEPACDGVGRIRFWQDRDGTTAATGDANARFVEVFVDPRSATYSLTPLIDLFSTGQMGAAAMAGLGSSICKQPPIMICHPEPGSPFNAEGRKGQGLIATGHSAGNTTKAPGKDDDGDNEGTGTSNTWSPGNFGFLQIDSGSGPNNKKLLQALAYENPPLDCTPLEGNKVNTGTPQNFYNAINTRFGIYNFPKNGNNTLAPCENGACPPAPNVRADLRTNNGAQCKLGKGNGNSGFRLPADGDEFKPQNPTNAAYSAATNYDVNSAVRMGLPRDLCHYNTYPAPTSSGLCAEGRIGDGKWAREDYWDIEHPGTTRPPNWASMTRYETYLWEIANSEGLAPACGGPPSDAGRRVMTIAVVSNCASLSGTSRDVVIDEFIDAFLVEPSIDDNGTGEKDRRHTPFKDMIYFEVIGKSKIAGNGVFGSQEVRRDIPYLVR